MFLMSLTYFKFVTFSFFRIYYFYNSIVLAFSDLNDDYKNYGSATQSQSKTAGSGKY